MKSRRTNLMTTNAVVTINLLTVFDDDGDANTTVNKVETRFEVDVNVRQNH
ncbi:MAG TPA: hypothetical protein VF248_07595 [Nitrososphaeraceae archaeon]